jgi:alpha-tubulin suppressor-like RCC1 family protein
MTMTTSGVGSALASVGRGYFGRSVSVAVLVASVAVAAILPAPDARAASAVSVSAGGYHSCAVMTDGSVTCWGDNENGALGDGTLTNRRRPITVPGLTVIESVSAGGGHTCALTVAGGVKCWGGNGSGQLGDGTTTRHLSPIDVPGLTSGVAAIATGELHTCILTDGGGVKCWGANKLGQLGDGTTTRRLTPVDVVGLTSGVAAISAGLWHTCAVTVTGGARCWGSNYNGELGNGTTRKKPHPVDVSGLTSGVAAISAGGVHTCALTTAGGALCWGGNFDGAVGDGTRISRTTPVNVSGLGSGVAAISAGGIHTCALTVAGGMKCWGRNADGELGDGTSHRRFVPTDVWGLTTGVAAISAGSSWALAHTCAISVVDAVRCWGFNEEGQVGDGTVSERSIPITVWGITGSDPNTYQPDGLISKNRTGPFEGGGVYNDSGRHQTVRIRVPVGDMSSVYVHLQNDGSTSDTFTLAGTRRSRRFHVRYFQSGRDVTGGVVYRFHWVTVAPGDRMAIKIRVEATRRARSGDTFTILLAARSTKDCTKKDVVRVAVSAA